MSLISLVATVSILWIVLHGLFRYVQRPGTSHVPFRGERKARFLGLNSSNTDITLRNVHLRLSTTAWNEPHDKLAAFFFRRQNKTLARCFKSFYNIGTVVGILGVVIGVLGLAWVTVTSYRDLFWPSPISQTSQHIRRRDLVSVTESHEVREKTNSFVLTPILPGITVPLHDLPVITISVFTSQIVHEFGHAIAGSLESIPVVSAGASLTLVIPTAFVAFSTASIASLEPLAHSRIIAAGPFHNFACWVVLVASRLFGLNDFLTSFWYTDISNAGRAVVLVEPNSPLYSHLSVDGAIITKLNDVSLASMTDVWTSYLQSSDDENPAQGWCVRHEILAPSNVCCGAAKGSEISACISDFQSAEPVGCVDPVPMLTNQTSVRCTSAEDCGDGQTCGVIDTKLSLLRIGFRDGLHSADKTLLWSGPRLEIWEQVQVSKWIPRWGFMGLGYLNAVQSFRSYIEMTALSLFFFNLLPAWHLDGMQLLETVLKRQSRITGGDPENPGHRWFISWRDRVPRIVSTTVIALIALNLVLQIYHLF